MGSMTYIIGPRTAGKALMALSTGLLILCLLAWGSTCAYHRPR